jgi:hypothetical protein
MLRGSCVLLQLLRMWMGRLVLVMPAGFLAQRTAMPPLR